MSNKSDFKKKQIEPQKDKNKIKKKTKKKKGAYFNRHGGSL